MTFEFMVNPFMLDRLAEKMAGTPSKRIPSSLPIGSMYVIFTYIYHESKPFM